ncbi:Aste57867_3911 [Aphanomyces stellatus]|uniref:Aste57867_3911 protein n=1 Tax=Aphanomyces stellatus TaxID=120398 RepID=A0A485KBI6_9STRA|nr:hypothetical protein As57867_003900 [Aphanomyces stellatus]VFT81050.1 Aste57867_3911 [Aphanomyces stellatus]
MTCYKMSVATIDTSQMFDDPIAGKFEFALVFIFVIAWTRKPMPRFGIGMAIVVATALAQTCSIQPDVDYPGNDLSTTTQDDPANCCSDCQNTPGCKAYNWDSGVCYLKSKKSKPVPSPGAVSGVLIPTTHIPPPTCAVQKNVDFDGLDIGSTGQDVSGNCCADCQAMPGCKFYTWYQGVCYLKAKQGRLSNLPGAVSGSLPETKAPTISPTPAPTPPPTTNPPTPLPTVAPTPSPTPNPSTPASTCTLLDGITYQGMDLKFTAMEYASDCCNYCRSEPACQTFTHYNGTCYLKSSVGNVSTLEGAISSSVGNHSLVIVSPPSTCALQLGMYYEGFEIVTFGMDMPIEDPIDFRISMDDCQEKCQAYTNCKLFTYVDRICTLRSDFGRRSPRFGAVTGTIPSDRFVTLVHDDSWCLSATLQWARCDGSTSQQWQYLRGQYLRNSQVGFCLDHALRYSNCFQDYGRINVKPNYVGFFGPNRKELVLTWEDTNLRVDRRRPTLDRQTIALVDILHPNPTPLSPLLIPLGNKTTNLCMAVNSSDALVARTCDSSSQRQKWSWSTMGGKFYLCEMPYMGQCLVADNVGMAVSLQVAFAPFARHSTQEHSALVLESSQKCLAMATPSGDNQRIVSMPCNSSDVSQMVDLSHIESFAWPSSIWAIGSPGLD